MSQPNSPNEKPPLNEQIADIALRVIMAGGVTGGGIGAFWSLFRESDIPKAIASAAIGLGISYAAKMLTPIHKGNERRLEEAGKAVDAGIDWVTDQVIAKATGFENKYRLCQASACQRLRSEGVAQYDRILIPLLRDVYVPLALDFNATSAGFRDFQDGHDKHEIKQDLDIWKILANLDRNPSFRQLAILAWGGYGKTTLLKHIAYRCGTNNHPKNVPGLTPVLLVLRDYRELLSQHNPPDLAELITQHHVLNLPGAADLKPPDGWAKAMLKRGDAIVMFDGFDEIGKAQRPAVARWINRQMKRYGKSVFILTSRPKAYKQMDAADRLEFPTALWVRDFDAQQRKDFVEKWYRCQERYTNIEPDTPDVEQVAVRSAADLLGQIEARQELKDLAKNPLLLNMIATFHRRNPGAKLPRRRVELYREIFQLQLRDRPKARTLDTLLTECEAQTILQRIAIGMMNKRWERIHQPILLQALQTILENLGETVEAAELLEQIEQVSELLIKQDDEYEFAHLSFQEYLASVYIAQSPQNREQLLYKHLEDDWWKPTILLYAAQTNPTRLIQEALKREATDLAYQCLQELPKTRRLVPELEAQITALKQTVQTSRYTQLESYLKNGQWKEADEETYRLMITTVGKDVGQWFEEEELLNFPCEELLAIDGLWVKYSNGKFGFSVQKDIYLDGCSYFPAGKYYEEALERFGDRVGWREDEQWEFSMKYDISSPKGHLPFVMVVGEFRGSLLSHPDL
ncbi:GUN4 domain-containing protein [Vacuolonema iberomarrocanum]|uniref:GUN4 domain-containing protein n=1 Tax=Vacuolonema iberomarrocanum TaxID=3454632 RepID=UPI0019E4192A|nr:GUN4 domain-containing protein [filamentous cyanobacterium LEGE 07170]